MLKTMINDAQGTAHEYELTLHRGSEGAPVTLAILSLVVEPLAAAVGPVLLGALGSAKGAQGASKADMLKALMDNPDLLESLDFSAMAQGARRAMMGISPALMYQVLKYTNRDGKPLIGTDGKPTQAFDVAYAGNYVELGEALWGAAQQNGFFPGLGSFAAAARQASAALREPEKKPN